MNNEFKNEKPDNVAYIKIQDMIMSSKIKPGEMITETDMSERLGISRTPVREAIQKLEQEGLIFTENRRKYVYVLTVKEIEEIFDIKICLESKMCYWASKRGTKEQKEKLSVLINEMENLVQIRPDDEVSQKIWFNKWVELDNTLHQLIFEMAKNSRATTYLNNLNKQWHRLRVGLMAMEDRIEKSINEHKELVYPIIDGNERAAKEKMEIHLQNLKRFLVQILKMFHYPNE